MILRTIAFFATAALAVACSAETGTTQDSQGTQPGASTGTPADDQAVYSVSCNGEIAKPASTELAIEPKCAGGPPGSKCGDPAPDACKAFDVKFHYAPPAMRCIGLDMYEWNGTECVAHNTHGEGGMLKCVGKDCERLFKSLDACTSFALECRPK